jgi:hypothetical protein
VVVVDGGGAVVVVVRRGRVDAVSSAPVQAAAPRTATSAITHARRHMQ